MYSALAGVEQNIELTPENQGGYIDFFHSTCQLCSFGTKVLKPVNHLSGAPRVSPLIIIYLPSVGPMADGPEFCRESDEWPGT